MDIWDGIIVGAASAAIGSIIAYKFLNKGPVGGDSPAQLNTASQIQEYYGNNPQFGRPMPLAVIDLAPTPSAAAPVVQVNPITEAAHNNGQVIAAGFAPAFGTNGPTPAQETVLPY
jgi:hypothetical protein